MNDRASIFPALVAGPWLGAWVQADWQVLVSYCLSYTSSPSSVWNASPRGGLRPWVVLL